LGELLTPRWQGPRPGWPWPWSLVFCLGFLAAVAPAASSAQEPRFSEFHTWTDITTIYNFNDRLRYDGDIGTQAILTDPYWSAFSFTPSVRYRNWSWMSLHGGTSLINNSFDDDDDLFEIRPWAAVQFLWPRPGGFTISHRLRPELRNIYIKSDSSWSTSFRTRYRLQAKRVRSILIAYAP
jgi:hypothetical protein